MFGLGKARCSVRLGGRYGSAGQAARASAAAMPRTPSGKIFGGCNVENATYGLTVCAERVAIFKAISEGEHQFDAIAVVTDTDTLTPPCGACRQLIWEFCGDVPVVMSNLHGRVEELRMSQLFPKPFDSSNL